MIVCEDSLRAVVVVDPIRSFPNIDFLDELQRHRIYHRDLILPAIACESVLEGGSYRDSMDARRIRDCAYQLSAVRIQDVYLGRMRNIEASSRTVQCNVVEAADAGYRVTTNHFVSSRPL